MIIRPYVFYVIINYMISSPNATEIFAIVAIVML